MRGAVLFKNGEGEMGFLEILFNIRFWTCIDTERNTKQRRRYRTQRRSYLP